MLFLIFHFQIILLLYLKIPIQDSYDARMLQKYRQFLLKGNMEKISFTKSEIIQKSLEKSKRKRCGGHRGCDIWSCLNCALCGLYSVAQLCLTSCDPMDCSPPGSSVRGVPQARILEWGTNLSSKGSSRPRDQTHVVPATGLNC